MVTNCYFQIIVFVSNCFKEYTTVPSIHSLFVILILDWKHVHTHPTRKQRIIHDRENVHVLLSGSIILKEHFILQTIFNVLSCSKFLSAVVKRAEVKIRVRRLI